MNYRDTVEKKKIIYFIISNYLLRTITFKLLSKMIKLNNLKTATQLHCSTVFHRSTFCHTEFLLTCSEALKATQFNP